MSRSHKRIDSASTFESVFPEESFTEDRARLSGDIDSYRASWEKEDYLPRHGKVSHDDSNKYESEEY